MQWQRIVGRTTGWTPAAYVPLRVALSPAEASLWEAFRPSRADWERSQPSLIVGLVQKNRLERLSAFRDVFEVRGDDIVMSPRFSSPAHRTQAFREVEATLRAEGWFKRWQDELYAAKLSFSSPTLFQFHRGVGTVFGLAQFATHLNGYVRSSNGVSHVWIATRSATKTRWPSLLDSIAAGGLPAELSAMDNMIKEAQEEAGLDPEWTRDRLVPCGSYAYSLDERGGLKHNIMFFFDIELPRGMTPVNQDGEVEKFELWPVQDVLNCLWEEPERFKPDVGVLLLDFFVRHGILTADSFRDYEKLQLALRGNESPYDQFYN